jgi:hypothetical protein
LLILQQQDIRCNSKSTSQNACENTEAVGMFADTRLHIIDEVSLSSYKQLLAKQAQTYETP